MNTCVDLTSCCLNLHVLKAQQGGGALELVWWMQNAQHPGESISLEKTSGYCRGNHAHDSFCKVEILKVEVESWNRMPKAFDGGLGEMASGLPSSSEFYDLQSDLEEKPLEGWSLI